MATSMYNHHRFARAVMKKFRKAPASLTIELHSEHWLFLGQQGKLEYDGPMRPFLVALREQAIPASLLNTILNATTHVPIYDGCLLIEIHDYRTSCLTPAQELANQASGSDIYQRNPFHKKHPAAAAAAAAGSRHSLNSRPAPTAAMGMSGLPCSTTTIHRTGPQTNGTAAMHTGLQASSEDSSCTKYRVVMKPDSVSMWEQLVHLNQIHGSEGGWDDQSVLQMESRILAAIAPPLALDTSFALSRTANLAMALTGPTLPHMAWDGTLIPRRERHAVQDGAINAKQVRGPVAAAAAAAADPPPSVTTAEKPSPSRGDAAKLGYAQREIDAFAKMGAPSVEDLSDRARASREEKASSPMSVWNWLSRTYGYHKLRRPGQEPPSNTIFTGQNTRASGGAVHGDGAAAAMMAIANERANGQQAGDDTGAGAGTAGTAAGKKKPTKKKKKDAAADEGGRGAANAVDVKPEDAAGDSSRAKAKSKKKKDGAPGATATATFAAVAPKGKKRGADEMSEAGSVVAAPPPPPSPSQPPRPAVGNTDPSKKPVIAPSASMPTSAPGKKLSKKQQRALEAAEREAARQQAAAAEPPKKKAKKSTFATTLPTAPSSSLALATPSIPPAGLAEVPPAAANAAPPADQLGNYDAPVDLSGEDYGQIVNANLLDPALPPDLAAMPIGEVPENIFMAAAADVDFAFPFAGMGGAEGETDASGSAPANMDFGGLGNPDEANLALAMLQQAQMPDQSRAPPGA